MFIVFIIIQNYYVNKVTSENLRDLLSEEINYFIVRVLRNSPLSEDAVIKYLKNALQEEVEEIKNHLEILEEAKILRSFSHGDKYYYLLVKDFYLIRRPPEELLEYLRRKRKVPEDVKEKYSVILKQYFESYVSSLKKLKQDMEAGLIEVFINEYLQNVIEKLKKKPYTYRKVKKKISNWALVEKILLKQNLIEILPSSLSSDRWVLLKTDIESQIFFPNYLIKNVQESLREEKMEKQLALKALYKLKNEYLKQEKPQQYEQLKHKAEAKAREIKRVLKQGKTPIKKANELAKIYKALGEYEKRKKLKIMITNERRQK